MGISPSDAARRAQEMVRAAQEQAHRTMTAAGEAARAGNKEAQAAFVTGAIFWDAVNSLMAGGLSRSKAIKAAQAQLFLSEERLRYIAPELFEAKSRIPLIVLGVASVGGIAWWFLRRR